MKHSLIILIYRLLGRMEKYNGQGTFTYSNGDVYVGEWKDGERWNGIFDMINMDVTYKFMNGKMENKMVKEQQHTLMEVSM